MLLAYVLDVLLPTRSLIIPDFESTNGNVRQKTENVTDIRAEVMQCALFHAMIFSVKLAVKTYFVDVTRSFSRVILQNEGNLLD